MIATGVALLEMFFVLAGGDGVSVQTTPEFCNLVKEQQEQYTEQGRKFIIILAETSQVLDDVVMIFCYPPDAME